MTYGRVLCQVVETPAVGDHARGGLICEFADQDYHDEWLRPEQDWPRDLLPWADPYIAVLMLRLERQYDWAGVADDGSWDDAPTCFDADDTTESPWQDDAFRPGRHAARRSHFPPVFGGFPLLDDVTDGLEEDPV